VKHEARGGSKRDLGNHSAKTARHWKTEYDEVRAVLVEQGLAK
jgi:hypothetical protein